MSSDGTIRKRADGRYELQIITGKTLGGKYTRKSFYGSGPREVKQKRDAWLEKQITGTGAAKDIGFSDWSLKWLKIYKEGKVRENTYHYTYRVNIENHINPFFGNTKLSNIKQADVQEFMNSKSHMAQSVLKRLKIILNDIFEKAIDNDLCVKNPCRGLKISSTKEETERKSYNLAQAQLVSAFAKQHRYGIFAFIMLKTGMRRGELLGLTWDNINLTDDLIYVKQQLLTVNKKSYIGEPKTKSSIRVIPFDKELHDYLAARKQIANSPFVVEGKNGNFLSTYAFNARFKKFMDDLNKENQNIPPLTPHELRHTYGTILREKGVDIYTIQKVLGHSDVSVTANIYVHNDIAVLKKAMNL